MAERVTQKNKRPAVAPRKGGRSAPAPVKRTSSAQLVAALELERDDLKAKLVAAQDVIAKLEEAREEAVDRIDWTIDSLHNLLESEA